MNLVLVSFSWSHEFEDEPRVGECPALVGDMSLKMNLVLVSFSWRHVFEDEPRVGEL